MPTLQTRCECQRVIGPPGEGPRSRRCTLYMAPTSTAARPGSRAKMSAFGLRGSKTGPLFPLAQHLGVEVVGGRVACPSRGRPRLEARPACVGEGLPAASLAPEHDDHTCSGPSLGRRRERELRVLLEVPDETPAGARGEPLRARRQRAQDLLMGECSLRLALAAGRHR